MISILPLLIVLPLALASQEGSALGAAFESHPYLFLTGLAVLLYITYVVAVLLVYLVAKSGEKYGYGVCGARPELILKRLPFVKDKEGLGILGQRR